MSKLYNKMIGTYQVSGGYYKTTRAEFYNILKDKFIEFGLSYNAENSTECKVAFDLNENTLLIFEDNRPDETTSASLTIYLLQGEQKTVIESNVSYINGGSLTNINDKAVRWIEVFIAQNETDFYFGFNSANIAISAPKNAFLQLTKADGTTEAIYVGALSNFSSAVRTSDGLTVNKFGTNVSKVYKDTSVAIIQNPFFYTANNLYLGNASNSFISNLSAVNTRYIVNGKEYLCILANTSGNSVIIPFPEILN